MTFLSSSECIAPQIQQRVWSWEVDITVQQVTFALPIASWQCIWLDRVVIPQRPAGERRRPARSSSDPPENQMLLLRARALPEVEQLARPSRLRAAQELDDCKMLLRHPFVGCVSAIGE